MIPISHWSSAAETATGLPSPSWSFATSGRSTTRHCGSCASPRDANDVAQIVFLKVAEHLDEYDPRYKFFSWIYRIAVNESLNLLRRNGREEALDEEIDLPGSESAEPERQASAAQVASRIRSALMKMSPNDRVVLTLRHFSECSYEEIGQILDLEPKTVKSRLFEARQRLRELLSDLN